MKTSKSKFIVDNYIVVPDSRLDLVASILNNDGVLYVREPWPDGYSRIYVRKDVKHVLAAAEKAMVDGL